MLAIWDKFLISNKFMCQPVSFADLCDHIIQVAGGMYTHMHARTRIHTYHTERKPFFRLCFYLEHYHTWSCREQVRTSIYGFVSVLSIKDLLHEHKHTHTHTHTNTHMNRSTNTKSLSRLRQLCLPSKNWDA